MALDLYEDEAEGHEEETITLQKQKYTAEPVPVINQQK